MRLVQGTPVDVKGGTFEWNEPYINSYNKDHNLHFTKVCQNVNDQYISELNEFHTLFHTKRCNVTVWTLLFRIGHTEAHAPEWPL